MIIKKIYQKIPPAFIHELIEKTNIIELINNYIKLKKTGNNYKSLCPFHYEKTPSFVVSPEKQFFYCFGCKIHGNAIDFLIKYEKIDFLSSITTLAEWNGIKKPYIRDEERTTKKYFYKKKIYRLLYEINKIYIGNLFLKPNQAYQYLLKRGIKRKTMQKFSLGFAILDNYQITNYIQKKNKNQSIIFDCGLSIIKPNNKPYDLFKERIIFPIKDKYGKIVGFGGRTLDKKKYPKYLNSPETITFHKKKNLYGIYELYYHNPKPKKILIVEGYLDVITLTQFNINYSVAILGTTITKHQIKKLFQISNNIIFCFDGDLAGRKANWISLNLSLSFLYDYRTINFIILPKNEDPSSLIIKEGKKNFYKRIQAAESLYSFLLNFISRKMNLNIIQDCIKLVHNTIPLIKKIPSKITQIYLRKMLGNRIGLYNSNQLNELLTISINKLSSQKNKPIKITNMRLLISLIIQNPRLVKKIKNIEKIKKYNITGKKIFLELIQLIHKNNILKTGHLIEFYRYTKWEKIFKYLSTWEHIPKKCKINSLLQELINNLKIENLESKYQKLITLEKKNGLTLIEKNKLWRINKKLTKTKNI